MKVPVHRGLTSKSTPTRFPSHHHHRRSHRPIHCPPRVHFSSVPRYILSSSTVSGRDPRTPISPQSPRSEVILPPPPFLSKTHLPLWHTPPNPSSWSQTASLSVLRPAFRSHHLSPDLGRQLAINSVERWVEPPLSVAMIHFIRSLNHLLRIGNRLVSLAPPSRW